MSKTPLHEAAKNNAAAEVRTLIEQGTDVNSRARAAKLELGAGGHPTMDDLGETPLHVAAWYNAHKAALVLLEQGAEVNARAGNGETPLVWAELVNASQTANLLRRYGARE